MRHAIGRDPSGILFGSVPERAPHIAMPQSLCRDVLAAEYSAAIVGIRRGNMGQGACRAGIPVPHAGGFLTQSLFGRPTDREGYLLGRGIPAQLCYHPFCICQQVYICERPIHLPLYQACVTRSLLEAVLTYSGEGISVISVGRLIYIRSLKKSARSAGPPDA